MAAGYSLAGSPAQRLYDRYQARLAPYAFVAPFFILFFVFFLGPVVFAIFLGLTKWTGLGDPQWIGLENYFDLVADTAFIKSTFNTFWYAASTMLLLIPLALVVASLLNADWVRLRGFFRAVYFVPGITSVVAVSIVFLLVYDLKYGFLNYALRQVGLPPLPWLNDSALVKPAILILILWRRTGFTMVYFLAGLQNIPRELYEAALVDGASQFQAFLNITVPLLRPIILFVAVITTIGAFQIFEEPYILTSGGPGDDSLSMAQFLYRVGFQFGKLGYGSAVGTVLFAIIFGLSLFQMRVLGAFRDD